MILKDIEVVRSMEYLLPQVGQKRLLQRKGRNLRLPQCPQPYIAPPKEGLPAIDHFINIFDNGVTRMLEIDHFFIMLFENFL